jgi:hypothetical protein
MSNTFELGVLAVFPAGPEGCALFPKVGRTRNFDAAREVRERAVCFLIGFTIVATLEGL